MCPHITWTHSNPYIRQTLLPPPTQARDQLAQLNPGPCQFPLAPFRHNWELLLQAKAKEETRQTYLSWTQDKELRGGEYSSLTSNSDHKQIGITKPSWTQLGLRPSNNTKLLLIRTMAVDLVCNSKFLDSKHTHISAETAFCPLCFAEHTLGPTQEHADNSLHVGDPLHKSSWGSTHQPIKVWQRNFLYHTTLSCSICGQVSRSPVPYCR